MPNPFSVLKRKRRDAPGSSRSPDSDSRPVTSKSVPSSPATKTSSAASTRTSSSSPTSQSKSATARAGAAAHAARGAATSSDCAATVASGRAPLRTAPSTSGTSTPPAYASAPSSPSPSSLIPSTSPATSASPVSSLSSLSTRVEPGTPRDASAPLPAVSPSVTQSATAPQSDADRREPLAVDPVARELGYEIVQPEFAGSAEMVLVLDRARGTSPSALVCLAQNLRASGFMVSVVSPPAPSSGDASMPSVAVPKYEYVVLTAGPDLLCRTAEELYIRKRHPTTGVVLEFREVFWLNEIAERGGRWCLEQLFTPAEKLMVTNYVLRCLPWSTAYARALAPSSATTAAAQVSESDEAPTLTNASNGGETATAAAAAGAAGNGATGVNSGYLLSVLQKHGALVDSFALHDQTHRQSMQHAFASSWYRWPFVTPHAESTVREYLGEKAALYFAFIGQYTRALWRLTIVCTALWLLGWLLPRATLSAGVRGGGGGTASFIERVLEQQEREAVPTPRIGSVLDTRRQATGAAAAAASPSPSTFQRWWRVLPSLTHGATSLIAIAWSVSVLEYWRRRNAALQCDWRCSVPLDASGSVERRMWREDRRLKTRGRRTRDPVTGELALTIPARTRARRTALSTLVLVLLLGVLAVAMYLTLDVLPRALPPLLRDSPAPSAAFAALIAIGNMMYARVAKALVNWEDWETHTDYERALAFDLALFQFLSTNASLVYLAFGKLDADALRKSLASMMAFQVIGGNVLETAVPLVMRRLRRERAFKRAGVPLHGSAGASRYVDLAEQHLLYETYDERLDYFELLRQFAQVTLFAGAFPLGALLAALNNTVEAYSDAYKMLHARRVMPRRAVSIGAWYSAFEMISIVAIFTNLALFAFTERHLDALAGRRLDARQRLGIVVLLEHLVLAVWFTLARSISEVPPHARTQMARNWRERVKMESGESRAAIEGGARGTSPMPPWPASNASPAAAGGYASVRDRTILARRSCAVDSDSPANASSVGGGGDAVKKRQ